MAIDDEKKTTMCLDCNADVSTKARFFLLVDLQEYLISDLGSGGRKK